MSSTPREESSAIRLSTQFGEFEAAASHIITFPEGLPGFERCLRFVVLRHAGPSPLVCLHAVDGPTASFLAIDPRRVLRRYQCAVSDAVRLRLGAGPNAFLLWLTIITIANDDELFVNLRAPVVINPDRLLGLQVMPHDALYPLHYRLELDALARTGTDGA